MTIRAVLVPLALALTCATVALADVTVSRSAAVADAPSTAARACEVAFRDHTPVVMSCEHGCYVENWDGPVLVAANLCSFPVWVSYAYDGPGGRSWRSPCYRLDGGGVAVAIPEPTIEPFATRRVLVAQEPGTTGYRTAAPSPACPDAKEVLPSTSR